MELSWTLYSALILFALSGCADRTESNQPQAGLSRAQSSSTSQDKTRNLGSGKTPDCGDQLVPFNGMSPTEILKQDEAGKLTQSCLDELKAFSAAYEEVLNQCKTELAGVGKRNPIAYLGGLMRDKKVSADCKQALPKLKRYLPPPPQGGVSR